MKEAMERKFTTQILSARKSQRSAAEEAGQKAVLKAFAGEPLAGSGFEDEQPDPDFSESLDHP